DVRAEPEQLPAVVLVDRLLLLRGQAELLRVRGLVFSELLAIRRSVEREEQLVQAVRGMRGLSVEHVGPRNRVVVMFFPAHRSRLRGLASRISLSADARDKSRHQPCRKWYIYKKSGSLHLRISESAVKRTRNQAAVPAVPTVDFYGDAAEWSTSALLHSEPLIERSR